MKNLANIITVIRIIFSVVLFFVSPFTAEFYVVYLICGISDILDGLAARKLHIESAFGAKLDSIADFVFVIAAVWKIFPVISVDKFLWIWVAAIALIKLINIVIGYLRNKKLVMLHTIANKVTGLVLFVLPLALGFCNINYAAIPVCILATFAAFQEGYLILIGKTEENRKEK